ncbi:hypothetical protein [Streptomyces sp. NPDC001828]
MRQTLDLVHKVIDKPWAAGKTTYTVRWNGGDSHEGASATATVEVGLRG